MKLKSKLIATIVSICAAIAVMGVGVWAATSSFEIAVSNKVGMTVENISGNLFVSATAGADNIDSGAPTLAETKIYDASLDDSQTTDARKLATSIADATASNANGTIAGKVLYFDGTDFLAANTANAEEGGDGIGTDGVSDHDTHITANTKAAALMYTFNYVANTSDAAGKITITVTQNVEPQLNGATVATSYYLGIGNNWYTLDTAITLPASTNFKIVAVCTYSNPTLATVTTVAEHGTWDFTVGLVANSAATATTLPETPAKTGTPTIEDGAFDFA